MIVIRNGTVLTAAGWARTDVGVIDGTISEIGRGLEGDDVIDAAGCLVGPGFVDLHAHLRDPGQTQKEDLASGSRAAAHGGFTAIVAMPNTEPALDTPDRVRALRARASEVGIVEVVPAGALTMSRAGDEAVDLETLHAAGVRIFTDDGDGRAPRELVAEIMARLAELDGAVFAQHAEDTAQTQDGHMHDGDMSRLLGVAGLPVSAETDIVARDLELVRSTGVRYHAQHVSAAATVDLIAMAKAEGLPVSAEVTPHHLALDDTWLDGLDPNLKMYPPLRAPHDRERLVEALVDGTLDVVATDHAPHTAGEKSAPFADAPRGVIGLETAASIVWELTSDPDLLFTRLAVAPAEIAGLDGHGNPLAQGGSANIVVFDPEITWVAGSFQSKSSNSPFSGRRMKGRSVATIYGGQVVVGHGMAMA